MGFIVNFIKAVFYALIVLVGFQGYEAYGMFGWKSKMMDTTPSFPSVKETFGINSFEIFEEVLPDAPTRRNHSNVLQPFNQEPKKIKTLKVEVYSSSQAALKLSNKENWLVENTNSGHSDLARQALCKKQVLRTMQETDITQVKT